MNKIIIFFISIIFITGCSFNKNSKFWTTSKKIQEENNQNYKEILVDEDALSQELNSSISINLGKVVTNNNQVRNFFNNDGRFNYDGLLKKSSRFKFSKIKNFYHFEPTIAFNNKNLIFLIIKVQFYNLMKNQN